VGKAKRFPRVSLRSDLMVWRLPLITMIGLVLSISTGAQAANPVPDKAGPFVTYCATHFDDCKNKIVATDVATLASALSAKTVTPPCAIPKGVDETAATKEILSWLSKHKNVDAMKTADGIRIAVKDLWRCRLKIGDGSVPGGPPAKTGAFVTYCSTHYVDCANELVAVSVAVMVPEPPKHCSPPDAVETKEMTTAVLAWLGQHKETYNLPTDDGITVAFDHLWPCH
jgi:hypothetical protein